MPIPAAQKSHIRERLGGFTGVNLRRDRLNLADEDVARAINADFHRQVGTAVRRHGRTAQFSGSLGTNAIRLLDKSGGIRYQIAGTTLYRAQTSILTGLHGNLQTSLVHVRPLNDTTTWMFIGDAGTMQKYSPDADVVRSWGIAAAAAPTIAAGSGTGLTGAYTAAYTYARVVGGTVIHEGNPATAPTAVTLTNEDLDITVAASSDAQVTHIRIYRTAAGGATLLFDQQVSNTAATVQSSQADTALGVAVETDNNTPASFMEWLVEFQGHIFLCRDIADPHYLWWTKRFRPEAIPSANFIELGNPEDPIQCAISMAGFLGVFTRLTKYRVFGNQTSGFTFLESLSARGTPAPRAVAKTERGVMFPARDGVWATNFVEADTELSQAIEPLFSGESVHDYAPIDWDQTAVMSMASYKDRLYFGYQDTHGTRHIAVLSFDTGRWYFFEMPARALYVEEDIDQLTAGFDDGIVYILESSTASNDVGNAITTTVETAERAGGLSFLLKRFDYLRVDSTGSWTIDVFIDDTKRATYVLSGDRSRTLLRLPANLLGHTWWVRATSTGTDAAAFHGVEMQMLPMEAS